jgi:hypothetical protein
MYLLDRMSGNFGNNVNIVKHRPSTVVIGEARLGGVVLQDNKYSVMLKMPFVYCNDKRQTLLNYPHHRFNYCQRM